MISRLDLDTDKDSKIILHLAVLENIDKESIPTWWLEILSEEITKIDLQLLLEEIPYIRNSLSDMFDKV